MTLAYKIIVAGLGIIMVLGSAAIVGGLVHNGLHSVSIEVADQ